MKKIDKQEFEKSFDEFDNIDITQDDRYYRIILNLRKDVFYEKLIAYYLSKKDNLRAYLINMLEKDMLSHE